MSHPEVFEERLSPRKRGQDLKRFQIGRKNRVKGGATVIPEAAERPTEPVKRDESFSTSLTGSMTLETQKRFSKIIMNLFQ